ncbi:hypothetical protein [Actinomadura hibisca]|uniref:hypothetical protein n=1 Tax=Actinomadura hibisca TaxID=68565 RepID=UPI00083111FA|nr:hypothetical protein [Actinomadura hibisca]
MGYPGDQGKSGGWPPEQPPHEPYGPGAGRPEPAPFDAAKDEAPFAPRGGGAGASWADDADETTERTRSFGDGGGSFGQHDQFGQQDRPGQRDQFGQQDQFGQEPFGGGYGGDRFDDGGSGSGPTPPGRGKRRNLPLIIGGSLVAGVLLIGGGVGASAMLKDDPKPAKSPTPPAAKQKPAAKPSAPPSPTFVPVKLKSRQTDPKPLSLGEVFGKSSFKAGGQKYVRAGAKATKGCTGTVTGAKLVSVLKKGGCSQALRASYARTDRKLIGSVGILNLRTENAAKVARQAALAKDAFLQPLPGAGSTSTLGKGEALGTAEVRGHYLVMTWVQRPDGKKIPTTAHPAVKAFAQQVIQGSNLSFALHYRETEGKPFRN